MHRYFEQFVGKQRRLERKCFGISEAQLLSFDCVNLFSLQGQCRTQLRLIHVILRHIEFRLVHWNLKKTNLYSLINSLTLLFRAQEPKAPVTYCDHALSGVRLSSVRSIYIFNFFSRTLVWIKHSRSLTSVVVFRPYPPRGGSRAGPN